MLKFENLTPDELKRLEYEAEVVADLSLVWKPHPIQAKVKNALFTQNKKTIFLECGRKFGKTEMLAYCLYRYCLLYPGSACYFIAPYQKQAKEIVWANGRLQNFFQPLVDPKTQKTHTGLNRDQAFQLMEELKEKYGVKVNESEMRIRFGNGSFIKLDGADSYEAYRGITPDLVVYDEFKDHHPKFHTGMDPNLASNDAPLIVVGTPPEGDENNAENFCSMADYADIADDQAYFNAPTYVNPHISKNFLIRKKKELYAKGEEDKWLREYMAKRVKSGARSIFPMFEGPDGMTKHTRHVRPHEEIIATVMSRRKDYDFFLAFDPASSTTFAGLFVAIHRYTKKIYVIEEIYAQKKANTSTGQVFPKGLAILDKYGIFHDDVRMIYDNAATWFANEVSYQFGYGMEPCIKDVNKKEERLSLIKDLYLGDFIVVSDKCVKFIWETENYRTDENGRIPKENDHLLDAFRYILSGAYYNQVPRVESNPLVLDGGRRAVTIEADLSNMNSDDPFTGIYDEYYA